MAYPSAISTLATPQPTDKLNSPSHSALHQSENTAITEIETFVGTLSSAVGTIVYDVRSSNSNGGGHVQTANKGGTGQTTFAKGDLLVATSSSVLSKLSVGSDSAVLLADSSQASGVKWGGVPGISVTSFLTSGVWTKPSTISLSSRVFVELWGAGGSGGMANGANRAGGGGGGGYVTAWYTSSVLATSVLVGVGVGGNSVSVNAGATLGIAGGNTVFDSQSSLLTAYGGGGGGAANASGGGGGGAGTTAVGVSSTDSNGGASGGFLGGKGANGGGATGGAASYMGVIAGGGGGGGSGGVGGAAIFGGGGGGGPTNAASALGGVSVGGGSGSAGSVLTAGSVLAGGTPAGGGGGGFQSGGVSSSGVGGNGMAVITTFI